VAVRTAAGVGITRTLEETSMSDGDGLEKTMRRTPRRRSSAVMLQAPSTLTLNKCNVMAVSAMFVDFAVRVGA